jgi:hypothetical protein
VKRDRILDRPAEPPHDAEQQVRLPLGGRQRAEQVKYLTVAGDGGRKPLVAGRYAARLARGELGVGLCGRHASTRIAGHRQETYGCDNHYTLLC